VLYTPHLTFPTLRLSYPFYTWGNSSIGRLSNLVKVTQLVNDRITHTLNHSVSERKKGRKKEILYSKGELQIH